MVEDIDPHIIGITESWANTDITDAELGLTGYVMFRRDRIGKRGGGVILYVKESIQADEIKLEREADYDESVWYKIVSGNSKLTIELVYRTPNINEEDNTKIQNAIKQVKKGECIIMGDFNHGHIQWKSLESTGGEDQQFLFLIQDSFLIQHVLEPTKLFNLSLEEGIVPSEWKEENITPLFKKGTRNNPENYRPVSLTSVSVVCKLLETLIRDHMVEFLIKHKLINTSQHGFLKARSCLTNLLCFFEEITKWVDDGSPVDVVYFSESCR